jgi:CheY-like chemotaxis protein
MLAFSGKGSFSIEPINLSSLVEETRHLLEAAVSKKAVLKFDLARDISSIEGDASQVRQVLMNLVTNASDAIGDRSGIITITTGVMDCDKECMAEAFLQDDLQEGCYTFIEVSDTGSGMDDATKGKVFDPFFSTKFAGRGLGLAVVLGIVRGHKGTIKLDSEAGRGSCFRILFPCFDKPVNEDKAGEIQTTDWRGGGTILVVDDEEAVREVAKLVLERAGFIVLTATDGREGVETYREHADEIDAVLLDLTMPQMGGEEVFQELLLIRNDVRVLLSSGYDEADAIGRFAGKGLAGFIQKPYRQAGLIEKLRSVLQQ